MWGRGHLRLTPPRTSIGTDLQEGEAGCSYLNARVVRQKNVTENSCLTLVLEAKSGSRHASFWF